MLKQILCIGGFALVTSLAFAQGDEHTIAGQSVMGQEGQMFTVKFTPGDRKLEVTAVGHDVATFDPDQVTLFGRVIDSKDDRKLRIVRVKSDFQILDQVDSSKPIEIKVQDNKSKKSETFRFKMAPKD